MPRLIKRARAYQRRALLILYEKHARNPVSLISIYSPEPKTFRPTFCGVSHRVDGHWHYKLGDLVLVRKALNLPKLKFLEKSGSTCQVFEKTLKTLRSPEWIAGSVVFEILKFGMFDGQESRKRRSGQASFIIRSETSVEKWKQTQIIKNAISANSYTNGKFTRNIDRTGRAPNKFYFLVKDQGPCYQTVVDRPVIVEGTPEVDEQVIVPQVNTSA